MIRSFFASALAAACLVSCNHQPAAKRFTYNVFNEATVVDGQDSFSLPVVHLYKVHDVIDMMPEGHRCTIAQIDSGMPFKKLILPLPNFMLSNDSKHPNVLSAYQTGDSLVMVGGRPAPKITEDLEEFKDGLLAKMRNLRTGQLALERVSPTRKIGDTMPFKPDPYQIVALEKGDPYTQADFAEEITEVSKDPKHMDLLEVFWDNDKLYIQFYPKNKIK